MPRKPNFVLVWWINDELSDIIETSKLPKTKRKKNDIATLIWTNHETGKDIREQVKILEFGNKEDLLKIRLDNKGNICDNNTKIFHQPIIERKRKLKEYDKVRETNIKKARSDLEEKLGKKTPLVTMDKPCEDQGLQKPLPRSISTRKTQIGSRKCKLLRNTSSSITEKQEKPLSKLRNPQKFCRSNSGKKPTTSTKSNTCLNKTEKQEKPLSKFKNPQQCCDSNSENKPTIPKKGKSLKNTSLSKTEKQEKPLSKSKNPQQCCDSNLENELSTFTCHLKQNDVGDLPELQSNIITKTQDNRSPLQELHPFSISNLLAKSDSRLKENSNNNNVYIPNDQFPNFNMNDIPITSDFQTTITPFFPPTYYQQLFKDSLNENNSSEIIDTSTTLPLLSSMTKIGNYYPPNVLNPELTLFNSDPIYRSLIDQSFNTFSNVNVSTVEPIDTSLDLSVSENDAVYSTLTPVVDSADQAFDDVQNQNLSDKESTELQLNSNTQDSSSNNIIDKQNSDLSASDDNDTIGALHTYFPREVTDHDVSFLRMVEASLEMMYYSQQKNQPDEESILQLNQFKESGENKRKIAPNCTIYFPSKIIQEIEKETEIEPGISDWTKLVTLALTHVYGEHLPLYTAKGRLSSQPGIDNKIRKGILEWARSRSKNAIRKESFVTHVNKLIQNRRGSETKWRSNQVTKDHLQFFHNVVKKVEKAHEVFKKSLSPSRRPNQLPEEFKIANKKTHLKISEDHEIYLPIDTVGCIMRHSKIKGTYDWKMLVKVTLNEIYDKDLKKYSALGTSGHRPGIDPELYEALYEWANSFMEEDSIIKRTNYTKFINSLTANKRKKPITKKKIAQDVIKN